MTPGDGLVSPAGDRRERACVCSWCFDETWNVSGICTRCRRERAEVAEGWDRADELDRSA